LNLLSLQESERLLLIGTLKELEFFFDQPAWWPQLKVGARLLFAIHILPDCHFGGDGNRAYAALTAFGARSELLKHEASGLIGGESEWETLSLRCNVDRPGFWGRRISIIAAESESRLMRSIKLAPAFLIVSSFALADGGPRIDLDQAGALGQLKQEHPQRYQAVSAALRTAEHAPCQANEIALLNTRFTSGISSAA
jgi:hypothetical protein